MKKIISPLAATIFCCGLVGTATAATYTHTYTGPLTIEEDYWVDVLIADSLGDLGKILDVNVVLDISHSFIGDLDIYIQHSVDGWDSWSSVHLYNNSLNESRNDMTNVTFDDQAADYINNAVPPYTNGTYKPDSTGPDEDGDSNELAYFIDLPASCEWRLSLFDNSSPDVGTLNSFSLNIVTDAPGSAVPLPGALVCLGTSLSALAAVRRIRRK